MLGATQYTARACVGCDRGSMVLVAIVTQGFSL